MECGLPDALDVSSGVETMPGKKDMFKVRRFLEVVSQSRRFREPRIVFP